MLWTTISINDDLEIDHVEITIDIDHTNIGDLIIEIRSPDGTTSRLLNRLLVDPGSTTDRGASRDNFEWTFQSTHFWGEMSAGEWTFLVRDAATGETGQLVDWNLSIYGDARSDDDTYIYTTEYGALTSGPDAARRVLTDGSGHDAINASVIFDDAFLDLRPGETSQLDGNALTIASGTVIEDAFLGDGNDLVIGNDVANEIWGGRGNDALEGGSGADVLDGGQGSDTASYANSASAVAVDLATGAASGGDAQGDILVDIENLEGSAFADLLTGDQGDNALAGSDGDDILVGADGSDFLRGDAGADHLSGGAGDDVLIGGVADDIVDGGSGSDTAYYDGRWDDYTISTAGGTTTVAGADGVDTLSNVEFVHFQDRTVYIGGGNSAPVAQGFSRTLTQRIPEYLVESVFLSGVTDADDDILRLGSVFASTNGIVTLTSDNEVRFAVDADFVGTTWFDFTITDGRGGEDYAVASFTVAATYTHTGTASDDVFFGLGSADTVHGLEGNDELDGGHGNDAIYGGVENDVLIGGAGSDILDGGEGLDTASYVSAAAGVSVDLGGSMGLAGDAAGDTFIGIENIAGSNSADTLTGNAENNEINGLGGNDLISGGGGNDMLVGGGGEDIIVGGDGDDQLLGGTQIDILRGGGGADILNGGTNLDIASYLDAAGPVIINLKTGAKSGADVAGDTYISIEGLEGTAFADQLTGDDHANILAGAGDNDILAGLLGSDEYHYSSGHGNDTLNEGNNGSDFDRLYLEAGSHHEQYPDRTRGR